MLQVPLIVTRGFAWLWLWAALVTGCGQPTGPAEEPAEPQPAVTPRGDGMAVEHTLRFEQIQTHYVDVVTVVPAGGSAIELMMAVWTPGSYQIRDYSRNVEELTAATLTGAPLTATKVAKNRWRIAPEDADRVVVRYRVYAAELGVRTSFVDASMAVLNGASIFLVPVGRHDLPHDVRLELPEGWQAVTTLPVHPGSDEHRFVAPDYDTLVDSPIVAGEPDLREIDVSGVPHVLATFGGAGVFDGERAAADVRRLAEAQAAFWGVVPYRRYVFFNLLAEGGGGGLEHLDSCMLHSSRWVTRRDRSYRGWLSLVSHELFHAWNVKRLRPVELGPFDYEREVHSRSLWVAEGFTSYYEDLLLHRAGLLDRDELLVALSKQIEQVQTTPGRSVHPLSEASFDAWIKYYHWDENSENSSISYYSKGAVVAFLLDMEIRRATDGRKSLDDAMRLAYERYSGERGYSPEDFRTVCEDVAGTDLDAFFARAVDSTAELEYGPALDFLGLRFTEGDDDDDEDEPAGWLGVETRDEAGRVVIGRVIAGTPAFGGGVNVGDEVLAVNTHRLPRGGLGAQLERHRPGETVSLLVARRGEVMRLQVTLGERPTESWELSVREDAEPVQRRHLAGWLATPEPEPDTSPTGDAPEPEAPGASP